MTANPESHASSTGSPELDIPEIRRRLANGTLRSKGSVPRTIEPTSRTAEGHLTRAQVIDNMRGILGGIVEGVDPLIITPMIIGVVPEGAPLDSVPVVRRDPGFDGMWEATEDAYQVAQGPASEGQEHHS